MTHNNETGHAKNVANFEKLVSAVSALGATYNPSKANLKLNALNTRLSTAEAAIAAVNNAESAYKNASAVRNTAFTALSKFVTRINNALKASDTTAQTNETAMALIRKLQGRRASAKLTEEEKKAATEKGKEIVEISSSHMSFDNRLNNLDKLIKLLMPITAYNPNEADLQITALTALYNDLKAKNTAAITAEVSLTNARIARNHTLYQASTGIVDISLDVKSYLKSVYGATSPQYKAVSKLKLTAYN